MLFRINPATLSPPAEMRLYEGDYEALETRPGFCHHCHTGRCPVGVATQGRIWKNVWMWSRSRAARRNYLASLTLEN